MIVDTPLNDVVPHPSNPRKGDVEKIAKSIREHGFHGALVVQTSRKRIIVGEHRWRAAQIVGLDAVPMDWKDVDDQKALEIMLADNRASDSADYDSPDLAALLESLPDPSAALWDQPDVDALLRSIAPPEANEGTRTVTSLKDLRENYTDAAVRQLIFGFVRNHYQWVVARLGELREQRGIDTNGSLLIALLEDATGKRLDGPAPVPEPATPAQKTRARK